MRRVEGGGVEQWSRAPKRWSAKVAAGMLERARQSGLSLHAFAKAQNLGHQRLAYWQKRLGESPRDVGQRAALELVPLQLTASASTISAAVEIEFGGIKVVVSENTSEELIARVLRAARSVQC